MLSAGILLTLIYIWAGRGIAFSSVIPQPWNRILYVAIAICVAAACLYFSKTTKVIDVHIKQGKLIIFTAIIVIILVLIYSLKAEQWIQIFKGKLNELIVCFFTALAAGVCEEFLFRNLVFNFFIGVFKNSKNILFWTSFISSIIFGSMHLVNLGRQDILTTLEQVCLAFTLGIILCSMHILSNSMWLPVALHFLWDFSPLVKTGISQSTNFFATLVVEVGIIAIIYLLWIWLFNRKIELSN